MGNSHPGKKASRKNRIFSKVNSKHSTHPLEMGSHEQIGNNTLDYSMDPLSSSLEQERREGYLTKLGIGRDLPPTTRATTTTFARSNSLYNLPRQNS